MDGVIPDWLLSAVVAGTVFAVMFTVGLSIVLGELKWIWQRPAPMVRGLFAVLIAVPALALVISRALELPRFSEIGLVLMAIAPGAPVALRRSLEAGGHRAFAPSLQIGVAVLAVISMPLSIAALNHLYGGHASISPWDVARQVCVAQLLPLGLGMAVRKIGAPLAARIEPRLRRISMILLIAALVLVLIDAWGTLVNAGPRVLAAIVLAFGAALAVGHWLGGPEPAMRTAVAISSAARNPGLALLVATVNHAPPEVTVVILAYLVVAVFGIVPYIAWRRRVERRPA
jgi:BASS family bile acid:Na+ symporter